MCLKAPEHPNITKILYAIMHFLEAAASFNPNTDKSAQIAGLIGLGLPLKYLGGDICKLSKGAWVEEERSPSTGCIWWPYDSDPRLLFRGATRRNKNNSGVKMEALNWISTHVRLRCRRVWPCFDPPCLRSPLISGRRRMCLAAINQMRSIFSLRGPTELCDWWRRSVRFIWAHLVDDFHFVNNHERR